MKLDELLRAFEERIKDRYFGKYEGVVEDTDDPMELGRLRARVPAVLGEEVVSGWALPCAPVGGGMDRGALWLPEVGDTVWIEFAAGDLSRPIWAGTFWGSPESTGQSDDLGEETGTEVPTHDGDKAGPGRAIWKTKAGHRIVLDDEGEVVIFAHGGDQAAIRLTKDGEVVVEAEKILLGGDGASKSLVLGEDLQQLFNSHTHPTGVGPSGPPTQPMTGSHLSKKSFTE
ncbi:MAG: phage baseplate assembly protein V [Myxococcota bacterium]